MSATALTRPWTTPARNRAFLNAIAIGMPLAIGAGAVAWRLVGISAAIAAIAISLAILLLVALRLAARFDQDWLIRTLDARRPDMEDSAALLFADEASLGPLQRLQRARLTARIDADTPDQLAPDWHRRSIALTAIAALIIVALALFWPRPGQGPPTLAPASEGVAATPGIPRLVAQNLRILPPAYTGLPVRDSQSLDARVRHGSRLEWTLRFDPQATVPRLLMLGGQPLALRRDGEDWIASRTADAAFLYRVDPAAGRGPTPPLHRIDAIADAVRDHYKPQGPNDAVPRAPLTVAVALADKLDTLVGFFAIDEKPTGSKDPFALRRAALGVIRLVLENGARAPLETVLLDGLFGLTNVSRTLDVVHRFADGGTSTSGVAVAADLTADNVAGLHSSGGDLLQPRTIVADLLAFFADRLKVLLRDQGQRHDLVDAVFALGDDDLVRIVRRVEALGTFLETEDGENLLAGYKRASNILRAEAKKGDLPEGDPVALDGAPPEETALIAAVAKAGTEVDAALATEDFAAAMTALAALRAPVDAFFTAVMVNSDVPAERDNRLKLLGQVRTVMGRVADFGKVGG